MVAAVVGLTIYIERDRLAPLAQPPAHGISFIVEADIPEGEPGTNGLPALEKSLLRRADRVGARIYLEPLKEGHVLVSVAAKESGNAESLQRALFRRGLLEFRLVHEESDKLIKRGELPFGCEVLQSAQTTSYGSTRSESLVVKKKPEAGLSGNIIQSAAVARGNLGEPEIHFILQTGPAAAFAKLTHDNPGHRLAIIVDGALYSAPVINAPIETGSGMIMGGFSQEEAAEIAFALDCALPFSVKVMETKNY